MIPFCILVPGGCGGDEGDCTVFSWTRKRPEIPADMVRLESEPFDEWGEPIWNDEIEALTHARGSDFLAPFLVELSPGMCLGGYLANAQWASTARSYAANAVLVARKNEELKTTVSIVAPACHHDGLELQAYTQRLTASLPKEHVANLVHTLRGLCEQAHAQELLKASSKPAVATAAPKEVPSLPIRERNGFAVNEFIVYPAHGVGQIVAIESQNIAGAELELFVISFVEGGMTLRVPTAKVANVGMRKISSSAQIEAALSVLTGCDGDHRQQMTQRLSRIESGDIVELSHVVRELRPSRGRDEMYRAAFGRLVSEVSVARHLTYDEAKNELERYLSSSSED